MFKSWKSLFVRGTVGGKRSARAVQPKKTSRRASLSVEALEDRFVPSTLTVSSTVDDLSAGTLRSAVSQANSDGAQGIADSIEFQTGIDATHILLQAGHLELTAGAKVTIWGTGSLGAKMVLNGDGGNLFQVDSGAQLDLHELTLAGGSANAFTDPDGGAIDNAGTLTLNVCDFVNDSATGRGGAIYNTGTINGSYASTFTGNTAQQGGGAVYNAVGGTASLTGSFSGNSAASGGALVNDGVMTVADSTLSGDSAQYNGGAVYNDGIMTVDTSALTGNTTQQSGGAIFSVANATMTVSTSTLANNSAHTGGAILNYGALTLSASTVVDNTAASGAGGIATAGSLTGGDTSGSASNSLTLEDTIVAGNTVTVTKGAGPDIDGSATAFSVHNLIGDGTGLSGMEPNNNQIGSSGVPINPLLFPLGNYGGTTQTMPLQPGSKALGAGGSVTALSAAIGTQDTVFRVGYAAAIASTPSYDGTIQIDGEVMFVTNVDLTNNTLTVIRASVPKAPTSHSAGAGVYFAFDQSFTPIVPSAVAIGADQSTTGPAVKFSVTGPTAAGEISGVGFTVTVTAQDVNGHTATQYTGPVSLKCSDGLAYPVVQLTNGIGTAVIGIDKAATGDTLTATDGSLNGISDSFAVYAGAAAHLKITAPPSATAGVGFNATITGTDWWGNPASGLVFITGASQVVESVYLSNGQAQEAITLDKAGTDALTASAAGVTDSTSILVNPGLTASLTVSAPSSVTAGKPFEVTVTALDAFGNLTPEYGGAIDLTPSDGQQVAYPLIQIGTDATDAVSVTLDKADTLTLTATGTLPGPKLADPITITGPASNNITVNPGLANSFLVQGLTSSVIVGTPYLVVVTALDAYKNVADYTGTVMLGSTDLQTVLSGNSNGQTVFRDANFRQPLPAATIQVTGGFATGNVLFETAATVSLTATGSLGLATITGTSITPIVVTPDWFSNNIADTGIQVLARVDFHNDNNSLTYDDMVGLFFQAQSELQGWGASETTNPSTASNAENTILTSLQTLAANSSMFNMPASLQYLVNQVANPDPNDLAFLAFYFGHNGVYSPDPSIPVSSFADANGILSYQFGGNIYSRIPFSQGATDAGELKALVDQWFLGTVYPDTTVTGGVYNHVATPAYTPLGGSSAPPSLYGPAGIPLVTDVSQGKVGDCWLLVTLADVAYHDPAMIENMITENDSTSYTINLNKLFPTNNGGTSARSVYVTVDTELPTVDPFANSVGQWYSSGTPNGAACFAGTPDGALWVALIEKAVAQLAGPGADNGYLGYSYQALSGDDATPPYSLPFTGINPLNYYAGNAMYSLMEITGLSAEVWAPDSTVTHLKATPIINELNNNQFVILGSPPSALNGTSWLVNGHEYPVLDYNSSNDSFLLYNPWGLLSEWNTTQGIDAKTNTTVIPISCKFNSNYNFDGIAKGDVIEIDSEMMLVTGLGSPGHADALTVQRGYDNTTVVAHDSGAALTLSFRNGNLSDANGNQPLSPFEGSPIIANGLEDNNTKYGLFYVSGNDLDRFIDREDTTQSFDAPMGNGAAPPTTLVNAVGGGTGGNLAGEALAFDSAAYGVHEKAGTITLTINRTSGADGTAAVHYDVSAANGLNTKYQAVPNADFTGALSGTVTFNPGETQKTVTFIIPPNDLVEENKSFVVTLSNPTSGASLGSQVSTTVTIVNDNLPVVPNATPKLPVLQKAGIGFGTSDEHYQQFVRNAYDHYLRRTPSDMELKYWVDQMKVYETDHTKGLKQEQIEAGFLDSKEYISRFGSVGKSWIDGIYQDLLARAPDASGESYWVGKLNAGMDPTQVAFGFTTSLERLQNRVSATYQSLLERAPDADELKYWVNIFNSGGTTEDINSGFVGSAEYYNKADGAAGNPDRWVREAYLDILFRAAQVSEMTYWSNFLNG